MKKLLALLLSLFVLLTFSCEDLLPALEEEEEEEVVVSQEEIVEYSAGASILAGYVSVSIYEKYAKSDKATTEASFSNLVITEAESGVTFTFNNSGMDMDQDGTAEITLDGSFMVTGSEASATITFSDLTLTGQEDGEDIEVIINGTIVTSGDNPVIFTITFTLSGSSFPDSVDVDAVMSMPTGEGGGDPTFTSAEINDKDYTEEFNTALEEMFADDGEHGFESEEDLAAIGTIMSGYISISFYEKYEDNGKSAVEASTTGLTITEGATVTFTFVNAAMDMDEDGETEFTLDGNYVVAITESSNTITYNNLKVTFDKDEEALEMVINGTIVGTGENPSILTSTFTLSGSAFSETLEVKGIMNMPTEDGGGDPSFTSASIDGEDQLELFNSVLSEFFSEEG